MKKNATVIGNRHGGMAERRAGRGGTSTGAKAFDSLTGRRSSGGGARFGAMACAARMAFDELTLDYLYGDTQCAPPTPSRRICRRRQRSVVP
jgi:hypothetical protein